MSKNSYTQPLIVPIILVICYTALKMTYLQMYLQSLETILDSETDDEKLFSKIVNAPFQDKLRATTLDLGIVVLLLRNRETHTIDRIALSNTELAEKAVKVSAKPFTDIKISETDDKNIIAKAIRTNQLQQTSDWQWLFTPALSALQARLNQSNASIECSIVYPFLARDGGALIYSFYQPPHNITKEHTVFIESYSKIVNNALQAV